MAKNVRKARVLGFVAQGDYAVKKTVIQMGALLQSGPTVVAGSYIVVIPETCRAEGSASGAGG